jgi:hypothetical protein
MNAVEKLFATAPIGRCPCCGTPTYDMAGLNSRCEECGKGVVASVAFPDWHRCGACLGTGRSFIWTKAQDDRCPVCRGCGYATDADFEIEVGEAEIVEEVLRRRVEGTDHWPPRAEDVDESPRGSIGVLRNRGMSPAAAKAWHKRMKASMAALDERRATHDFRFWDAVEDASRAGSKAATKSITKSNDR